MILYLLIDDSNISIAAGRSLKDDISWGKKYNIEVDNPRIVLIESKLTDDLFNKDKILMWRLGGYNTFNKVLQYLLLGIKP